MLFRSVIASIKNLESYRANENFQYAPWDDTTKLFMTSRTFHPAAIFKTVWGCNPDTDVLQIELELVSRDLEPPVLGGQIGIRLAVDTYEFRYTPPNNPCKSHRLYYSPHILL